MTASELIDDAGMVHFFTAKKEADRGNRRYKHVACLLSNAGAPSLNRNATITEMKPADIRFVVIGDCHHPNSRTSNRETTNSRRRSRLKET